MRSLDRILELGPSGLVFAASTGESIAQGYRNLREEKHPALVTINDSFDLASITKIICTTSIIMTLISDGELSLQTRVSHLLPAWRGPKSDITIEDLLRHRAGLEPWRPLYIGNSDIDAAYDFIARLELVAPINSIRSYSDLGFITLGQLINIITGSSIDDVFHSMVASRYGLSRTQFRRPVTDAVSTSRGDRFEYEMVATKTPYQIPESVDDFSHWRQEILCGEVSDGNAFHVFSGASAHAGLFATADEILTFAAQIRHDPLFPTFTAPGPDPDAHCGFISWESTVEGCTDRIYGHTGFTGVAFGISSRHQSEMVLLTNRTHTEGKLTLTTDLWKPVIDEYHEALHG